MKYSETWRGRAKALLLAAAGVALVTVGASAARQTEGFGRGPGMRGPFPFAHLNLTNQQRSQMRAILDEQRSGRQDAREELRKAHDELRAAIFGSANPDTGRIDELVTRIASLEADALKARVASEIKIASILTDEQRQELASAQPRRGSRRGHGPGNR